LTFTRHRKATVKKLTQKNYEAIRDHIFERISSTGQQIKLDFPNTLRFAIEHQAWKHFTTVEGKPFANLVEWLHYTFPHGTSMGHMRHDITYEDAIKLTDGAPDVQRVLLENAPNNGHGGDRRSPKAKANQGLSSSPKRKCLSPFRPPCPRATKVLRRLPARQVQDDHGGSDGGWIAERRHEPAPGQVRVSQYDAGATRRVSELGGAGERPTTPVS
jgi:hypothetical protein